MKQKRFLTTAKKKKKKKNNYYKMTLKIDVISFPESNGNHTAGRKFNVDLERIREWRQENGKH